MTRLQKKFLRKKKPVEYFDKPLSRNIKRFIGHRRKIVDLIKQIDTINVADTPLFKKRIKKTIETTHFSGFDNGMLVRAMDALIAKKKG